MDLMQDPEVKKTYDKSKYKVKVWEHNFKKQYGRVPSKVIKQFICLKIINFKIILPLL